MTMNNYGDPWLWQSKYPTDEEIARLAIRHIRARYNFWRQFWAW